MTFDYIDYQLLRQTLLTNRRKPVHLFRPMPNSPSFMIVADKTISLPAINKPPGNTTWGKDFILIEQPSRHQPGINRLIEKEAFHLFGQNKIKQPIRQDPVLVKIHLAQRYPTGKYDSVFSPPASLLDSGKQSVTLNHYMQLETQFRMNDGKPIIRIIIYLQNKIDKLGQKLSSESGKSPQRIVFTLR